MDDPTGLKRTGSGMYRGALDPEREPPFILRFWNLPLDSDRYCNLRSLQRLRDFRLF
jgi:hypothetical protein